MGAACPSGTQARQPTDSPVPFFLALNRSPLCCEPLAFFTLRSPCDAAERPPADRAPRDAAPADLAPSERPPREAAMEGASATDLAPRSASDRPDRSKPCGGKVAATAADG